MFEYNDEDFDTDIASIDEVEEESAFQYALTMDSASTGFTVGETIIQAFTDYDMKGEVTDWSDSDKILQVAHAGATDGKFHTFTTTENIVGTNIGG